MGRRLARPRIRIRSKVRRGHGHVSEVAVFNVPEEGELVRLTHRIYGVGDTSKSQHVFDYTPEEAMNLGRDLIGGGRAALGVRRELEAAAKASR